MSIPRDEKSGPDRRQLPRLNLTAGQHFTQAACCGGLGKVLDISLQGLSVLTDNEAHGNPGPREVDLFFANDLLCIRKVPCQLVSFRRVHLPGAAPEQRLFRGSFQFLSLSAGQSAQLRFAIRLNAGTVPGWPPEDHPVDPD